MTNNVNDGVPADDVDGYPDDYSDDDAGELSGPSAAEAERLSARSRAQRRLAQARTSVAGVSDRARQSALLPARRTDAGIVTDSDGADIGIDNPTGASLAERVAAYRLPVLAAVATAAALVVLILTRRAASSDGETLDLGTWRLRAEPLDD